MHGPIVPVRAPAVVEAHRSIRIPVGRAHPSSEVPGHARHAEGGRAGVGRQRRDLLAQRLGDRLIGVEREHPVVARQRRGVVLLRAVPGPRVRLHARGERRGQGDRRISAAAIHHDPLLRPRHGPQGPFDVRGGVLRDEDHRDRRRHGGSITRMPECRECRNVECRATRNENRPARTRVPPACEGSLQPVACSLRATAQRPYRFWPTRPAPGVTLVVEPAEPVPCPIAPPSVRLPAPAPEIDASWEASKSTRDFSKSRMARCSLLRASARSRCACSTLNVVERPTPNFFCSASRRRSASERAACVVETRFRLVLTWRARSRTCCTTWRSRSRNCSRFCSLVSCWRSRLTLLPLRPIG